MFKYIMSAVVVLAFTVSCGSSKSKKAHHEAKHAKDSMTEKMDDTKKSMTASTEAAASRTCSLKKDKRIINIVEAGSGCEVQYTKWGETKSIATSANGMSHCETVSQKIAVNLAEAGFDCN